MRARMDPGHAAKEDAVFGHGEVDARGGENGLAQKAEGGESDARSDERAATRTQRCAHHGGSGRGGCGESGRAERADVHKIHGSVDRDDAENAQYEATREGFARVADFAAEKAGGLPA